eukprot:Clim_evm203s157 gene=Clim_evmTU203s157
MAGRGAAAKGADQLVATIKGYIPAQKAAPGPPLGPALGARGVNIGAFTKAFNDGTRHIKAGTPLPANIYIYGDRSFKYDFKTPPVSHFIKEALGVDTLSATPKHEIVGTISLKHCYEIAKIKAQDPNHKERRLSLEQITRQVVNTCITSGVNVYNDKTGTNTHDRTKKARLLTEE